MEKKKVTVFVSGQKLTLITTETEKYVNDIASKVETTINSLFAASNLSKEKCAIMAALDFCDDEAKARASMNEIKEQIKDYIEEVAQLKEENAKLKLEIERLEDDKKTLLNSKKTMIATKVDIKEEKVVDKEEAEISAEDDLFFDEDEAVETDVKKAEVIEKVQADSAVPNPKKADKKRHEHKHVNPFKERFKQQNDGKGYTPVRQYSLFEDNK